MVKQHIRTISHMVSFVLFTLFSTQLLAEKPLKLDDLLVTASLQPISINDVASSVTVITREEIELKQVKYLSELLRDVPGFSVSQAGGPGSQTQVRVRGAEANQLLVLVDGIRANDPAASGEFQYQFALTSNIERIEIIRGPQSATWGSDAMAGVINIIRKKDNASQYISGTLETGSFNTVNAGVDGGYSGDRFHIYGGLSYLDSSGSNISRSGDENDGTENTTANIALEFEASDAFSMRFSGQVVDVSSEFDDIDFFVTGLPVDADRMTESRQTFLNSELHYKPQQNPWSGSISVNWMESDNNNFSDALWTSSTNAETLEFRLRGGFTFGAGETPNNRISFALEREDIDFHQRGEASVFGDPNQDQSYAVNSYALEYVGKPISGFTWTMSSRLDDYNAFDDTTTWQLAASYQLFSALRIRGSVGTGSKAPTFTERFGFFADFFIGNPNLKPESSQAWEIGLDTRWHDDQFQIQLVYFDQDLQDEIDGFVFDPDSFLFTAQNKDSDSRRKGVEALFDARLSQAVTLSASYTYTDASEIDAAGLAVSEVRRPEHVASISASYYYADDRGNLNLSLNHSGKQQDVFFSPTSFTLDRVDIDAFTVLDLAASWKLTQSLELTGRISNLFDEEYEEILGFARPGQAVYVGLRGRFNF